MRLVSNLLSFGQSQRLLCVWLRVFAGSGIASWDVSTHASNTYECADAAALAAIQGSRVIWIDDHPAKLVALRRLFRSLGISVHCADSSETAEAMLKRDSDFDLVITDVQREGDSHQMTGGIAIHEGVNFLVWLRTRHDDFTVREMPAAIYAAYDWERLVKFTEPARATLPEPSVSNNVPDFIDKVIHQLARARSTPLKAAGAKVPTSISPTTEKVGVSNG